jgi:crotonobetainyl-CoA:carnitine CoA-transferase CaiB-like acyl-CoA transferase
LIPLLAQLFMTRTKADWLAQLEAAKVPCGAINNLAEVFADPHVTQRHMVSEWQHPLKKNLRLVSSPMKLSETPVQHKCAPPTLGQHTDEVLRELLGWQEPAIAALRDRKLI